MTVHKTCTQHTMQTPFPIPDPSQITGLILAGGRGRRMAEEDIDKVPKAVPDSPGHHREWLDGIRTRRQPSCHVGYRSCFYRKVPVGKDYVSKQADGHVELEWTETEKVFDPEEVYGDAPNPTIL